MPGPLSFNGLPLSGTTAQRPTNAEIGQPYFDITLGVQLYWNGTLWVGDGIGYIHIPLSSFRIVATNDISAKGNADGGTLSLDTDPKYKRENAATDKALRIAWESGSILEITSQFLYPPDIDEASPLNVNLLAGMKAGSVDTPVIAVGFFENVGDANAGGNTPVLGTTIGLKSVAIAAADVGAYPAAASISLTPGAHATASNDVLLYGCSITYRKKLLSS